jgi:tRNA nucleotidyltransferase (CCA-adding enzyme)
MRLDRSILTPAARRALKACADAGGRPVLAGGCVRDALLHVDIKDFDVEVYGDVDPDRLCAELSAIGAADLTGKAFGVMKVRLLGEEIDVSLPRRDIKTAAGHRGFDVVTGGDLSPEDASARRDFTVNAMMADPLTGEVTDRHGGLADLYAGVLRHTGPAFTEDPLRVLRGMRFAARYGFTMAPETVQLCRSISGAFAELPAGRVWGEFRQLGTRGTDITAGLAVLADTGWERHFPQLAALHGIRQDRRWHPEGDAHVHSGLAADQAARLADEAGLPGDDRFVVVMAALLHDLGKAARTRHAGLASRLLRRRITSHGHAAAGVEPAVAFLRAAGCPDGLIMRITPLVKEHMSCQVRPSPPAVRRLARRLQPATLEELALICSADRKGRGDPDAASGADAWLEMGRGLSVQEEPVRGILTGYHLIAAGMIPGPAFRPVLAAAVTAQDAGEFADEEGALQWLTGNYLPAAVHSRRA